MNMELDEGRIATWSAPGVVVGHSRCQTYEAKWLCVEDIYQKLHRDGDYDIGGTYIEGIGDYWFMYKTNQFASNYLMHMFICNKDECSFAVSLSYSSDIAIDNLNKKRGSVSLSELLTTYYFDTVPENTNSYVTTYCFSELDVETLKGKKLYIAINFSKVDESGIATETINEVKASHDFGALLTDPVLSDFTIESASGEKFAVHKVILTAHSEVFKAMLKEETAESQNKCVKLDDVSQEDLRLMLEFIYTGTVQDMIGADSQNLLVLGDRYDLQGLSALAEHSLCRQVNVENAVELLVMADMHNSYVLKHSTMKFIKQNRSVLESDGWKQLNDLDVMRELLVFVYGNC